jgi:hypothetical protein
LADAIRDYTPTLANRLNDPTSGAGLAVDAVGGLADMLIGQPYRSMNNLLSRPYVSGDPQAAEDAFNVAGAAMVGGLAAPRPRNSLGTVGRPEPPSLPMDEASRMARAREMGFHPRPHYHGTAATFDQFDLTRGGQTSGARAGGLGVSVSPSADVANEFATLAANKSGGDPSVMPLMIRPGKPAAIQLTGAEKNLEVAATLDDAFKQGYDSVVLKNYTTPGGGQGNVVVVVRDPSQLRSTSAAFDPAQAHSPNLLAANGGRPGALAGASINALADNQAPSTVRAYRGSNNEFALSDFDPAASHPNWRTNEGALFFGSQDAANVYGAPQTKFDQSLISELSAKHTTPDGRLNVRAMNEEYAARAEPDGAATVMPADINTSNFGRANLSGYRWDSDEGARLKAAIDAAKAQGRDGLSITGMMDASGYRDPQYAVWGRGTVTSPLTGELLYANGGQFGGLAGLLSGFGYQQQPNQLAPDWTRNLRPGDI